MKFVDVVVTASETDDRQTQLRELYKWLTDADALRGHIRFEEAQSEDTLGSVLEGLAVALGPAGGLAAAFATTMVAWLRSRAGYFSLKVTASNGQTIELTAKRVAGLDTDALRQQISDIIDWLGSNTDRPESRSDS